MAKNKVINTVLTVQDKLSGGLVEAAKNAKKSGKAIDGSMLSATRSVVAFKNKSVKALTDTAKKGFNGLVSIAKTSALAITASITGIAVGFAALDGATEEYRIAQGKLNAGFQAAGLSADTARKSYRNFYAILGDTDTATEASQLLANMAKNDEEVTKWTRIAAGVHGTFGDSLPIEGLVESANETARTGQITGVFADAINWATKEGEKFGVALKADTEANKEWNEAVKSAASAEDFFNLALKNCSDESARQKLIVDTLSKTYDKAADSFYANNQQVVNARRNHATLDEMLAKVGDTSSKVKNQLWVLAGAAEDGSIRSGSALDWIYKKAADLSTWISGLDLSNLQTQVDKYVGAAAQKIGEWLDKVKSWVGNGGLTVLADKLSAGIPKAAELAKGGIDLLSDALDKAKDAIQFCKDHSAELKTVVGLLGIAFGMVKLSQFNTGLTDAISNIGGFIQTIGTMIGVTGAQAAATGAATTAQTGLNIAMNANPIGAIILAVEALITVWLLFGDKITDTAQKLWNKFKDVSIRIGTAFSGAFDKVKNAAKTALEWVADKLSWLNDMIESIPILGSLYKGAKGVLGDAIEWVDNATTGNRSGTSTGTTQTKTSSKTTTTAGPVKTTTSTTTTIPKPTPSSLLSLPSLGNATGTPYWRGGYTRVNERGGEIMNLPSGTQIIPHDVSVKAAGGRSVTVNVTIQGNVIGNREYTEQVGEYVGRKVLAALGNT